MWLRSTCLDEISSSFPSGQLAQALSLHRVFGVMEGASVLRCLHKHGFMQLTNRHTCLRAVSCLLPYAGIPWMRLHFPAERDVKLFFLVCVVVSTCLLAGAIFFVYPMLPFFGFPRAFQCLEHPFVSRYTFVSSFQFPK